MRDEDDYLRLWRDGRGKHEDQVTTACYFKAGDLVFYSTHGGRLEAVIVACVGVRGPWVSYQIQPVAGRRRTVACITLTPREADE